MDYVKPALASTVVLSCVAAATGAAFLESRRVLAERPRQLGHTLMSGAPATICDLVSDRTIVAVVEGTVVWWGSPETREFRYFGKAREVAARRMVTPIRLNVMRVLRGVPPQDVWIGDAVLSNGDSIYGNLKTTPSGIWFVRHTGGNDVIPSGGFLPRTGQNDRIQEVEAELARRAPGTPCPGDATQARYDTLVDAIGDDPPYGSGENRLADGGLKAARDGGLL